MKVDLEDLLQNVFFQVVQVRRLIAPLFDLLAKQMSQSADVVNGRSNVDESVILFNAASLHGGNGFEFTTACRKGRFLLTPIPKS